ncbi:hypothetical protein DCCM_0402 [Desulfocucumis palustris]|uniref:Uncharacterized protein n=1 Tax=Desulfocucumis palustris TaxID=1898651 RepID=A0A2L2XEF4_9FIRM|nr:hypothetical protein [Desulfocucumis palustris]GBF32211.1 hypothetical protein DCCM_0402 [Desulfocucumis palustris]
MALAAPVISWRLADNSGVWPSGGKWDLGVVDAGFELPANRKAGVLIWNNYANTTDDAPDMQDVNITTANNEPGHEGAFDGPVVEHKMIRVKNVSVSDGNFTAIGGTGAKHIYTTRSTNYNGVTSTPHQNTYPADPDHPPAHYPYPGHTVDILGVKNDGDKSHAMGNFVEVLIDAFPPAIAPAGKFEFLLRISYWY